MRVLVTGNNGYIGPMVENELIRRGHQVIGLDVNYFEPYYFYPHETQKKQIFKDVRLLEKEDLSDIDGVIHLAALSNDPMGAIDEQLTFDVNYEATRRLADLCKQKKVARLVYASSCSVYGIAGTENITEGDTLNPLTAYAKSKALSEKYLSAQADAEFSPVMLRFATAFGASPRLRLDLVVNNLAAWGSTTGNIKIMSDGTPWRPIIHIRDMATAMITALEAPKDLVHNGVFNVGKSSHNYQIKQMAETVQSFLAQTQVSYTFEHGSDSRSYNVSFAKLEKTFPQLTIEWNLKRGVEELLQLYSSFQLPAEELTGWRYIRLNTLKKFMQEGKLDKNLFWTK